MRIRGSWSRQATGPTVLVLLASGLALVAAPSPSTGAPGRPAKQPNLVVSAVSPLPNGLSVGSTFLAKDTTKNNGTGAAAASVTRFYLTTDPAASRAARKSSTTNPRTSPTDILLTGARTVGALRPGKTSPARGAGTELEVPGGTPVGSYYLLACADDRGAVKEKTEHDNCKASSGARPLSGPPSGEGRVDAFSDTAIALPSSIEATIPALLSGLVCSGPTPVQSLTLKQAIASTRAYLSATAGADAMSAFQASAAYDSASAAEDAAGQAVLANMPGAALASLVRAHELQPKEASHLVNAGGVAASIGRPNEALAFLDAALRLDDADAPPMGISRQAVALASRGYAELQLGRYGRAEAALRNALAIDPLLTEAQATLAGALACQGKNPVAAFKKGRQRQDREPPIDDSLGKVTQLRALQYPATARNAYSALDYYRGLAEANEANGTTVLAAIAQLEQQMNTAQPSLLPAARQRTDGLRALLYQANQTSELLALSDEIQDLVGAGGDVEDAWAPIFGGVGTPDPAYLTWIAESSAACSGSPDPHCYTVQMRIRCIPEVQQAHGAWLVAMDAAREKSEQWIETYSESASAIGSNFKGQAGHDLAQRYIELNEIQLYGSLVHHARLWAAMLEMQTDDFGVALCVQSPDPPGYVPPPPLSLQGAGRCPDELKSLSFSVAFGPVNLSGNCEELTASGSSEGWIGGFGEVTLNARDGTVTVFGGAKGEVGLGPLAGDFKSGVYVKVGLDGPRDVGWRVGPSYTVGAGPAQFGGSDQMDLSFVGALGNLGL